MVKFQSIRSRLIGNRCLSQLQEAITKTGGSFFHWWCNDFKLHWYNTHFKYTKNIKLRYCKMIVMYCVYVVRLPHRAAVGRALGVGGVVTQLMSYYDH